MADWEGASFGPVPLAGWHYRLWTVSPVAVAATRLSEIHRGVPGIFPTLLSRRLKEMEQNGQLTRTVKVLPKGLGGETSFAFRYRSPQHVVDVFRQWYGPVLKAFASLPDAGKAAVEADFLALIGQMDRATDGTVVVGSAQLEVVVTRR